MRKRGREKYCVPASKNRGKVHVLGKPKSTVVTVTLRGYFDGEREG